MGFLNNHKVWVLDATPGKVRQGGHGEDRPGELIDFLCRMPQQVVRHCSVLALSIFSLIFRNP